MYVRLWLVYHLACKIDGNINMFQYIGQIVSTCKWSLVFHRVYWRF